MHSATFQVNFHIQGGLAGYARLVVQLAFAPTTDMEYEHGAWREPRRATSVTYNLQESTFYVELGVHQLEPGVDIKRNAEMYRSHVWDVTP